MEARAVLPDVGIRGRTRVIVCSEFWTVLRSGVGIATALWQLFRA